MPILSDGQLVGISSQRARYHATRLNISITRDTPHRHLYHLVDIVFADARDKPESWQNRYRFSGHTLSDTQWLNSFTKTDRACLLDWLEQSYVRYEIEGARRKLIYDELPAAINSHPYPEYLYSNLRKRISSMPETNMPARQWRQTLLNLRHKGISQEELNWSGILTYLAQSAHEPDKRIDKQTLLAKVDFSNIRIDMSNELVAVNNENNKLAYRARYRHISLFGGEDYREWLLSLPDYQASHFSAHFTDRNILLHIRTKTRFDIQGRKLLFIEEIQSDWHQLSVKKTNCFAVNHVPTAPFRKNWVSLGLKLMLLHAVKEGFDGLAWADGEVQKARYKADIPSIRRIYDKMIAKHLLSLSRTWGGRMTSTELVTKVPWFQIKRLQRGRRLENRHESIKRPGYNGLEILSILEQYSQAKVLESPLFLLPDEMAESIRTEGLPLFGEQI